MTFFRTVYLIVALLWSGKAFSQTINWGNDVFDPITNSFGEEVDNTYFFELGGFFNGFDPTTNPTSQWLENWRVLDSGTYDTNMDVLSGRVDIRDEDTRDNPTGSTADFAGLDAYIWIRKGDQPVAGSEWLLVRASDWVFPSLEDCCNTDIIQFSTDSDLVSSDVPLWGRQYSLTDGLNVIGPGEYTADTQATGTLQTYTFPIPEPMTAWMILLSSLGLLTRRHRVVG